VTAPPAAHRLCGIGDAHRNLHKRPSDELIQVHLHPFNRAGSGIRRVSDKKKAEDRSALTL
jgi:hypothetical protein